MFETFLTVVAVIGIVGITALLLTAGHKLKPRDIDGDKVLKLIVIWLVCAAWLVTVVIS